MYLAGLHISRFFVGKRQGIRYASDEREGSSDEGSLDVIPGARPSGWNSPSSEDEEQEHIVEEENEDNFIEDDDAEGGKFSLPAAFSMQTHQDLSHHFKIFSQYLVHLLITPNRRRRKLVKSFLKGDCSL